MAKMSHHELTIFFLALAVLLLVARAFGEAAKKLNQPAVLGEMLAGILLGPTLFGMVAPGAQAALFPTTGAFPIALQAITSLAIALFLLVAGIEVDLSTILRQGRAALVISFFGMVIPFGVGFAAAWFLPWALGAEADATPLLFSLFVGTALAISALPVIAKTLMDLNLFRSDFGMIVISVAVIDDLTGWMLFALLLGMMGGVEGGAAPGLGVEVIIGATLAFVVLILTVGRWLINKALPVIQAYTSWPEGVLGFAIVGGLACAAFTEWIGIHAIFGAFLFGVALGDSRHLREKTRHTLENFISSIFAPLFFASIGLHVNFATHFDLGIVLFVLFIASVGKLIGCGWASRMAGFSRRESLAVGIGMNARGGMGIILALLGLEAGLIGERLFVALVVMSLVTSSMAGGLMQKLLQRKKTIRFFDYLAAASFIPRLAAREREEAIRELAAVAARPAGVPAEELARVVWEREQLIPTGIGRGVAIPHARLAGLKGPVVAAALSRHGVDFDSPDGEPAHLVIFILTPRENNSAQLELLGDIGRTFHDKEAVDALLGATSYVEFIAGLKSRA